MLFCNRPQGGTQVHWKSDEFISFLCRQHKEEVSGDIFDMLLTFTDFMAFKEMFLQYRAVSFLCYEVLNPVCVCVCGTVH